jgi:bla regulator protein blaR1
LIASLNAWAQSAWPVLFRMTWQGYVVAVIVAALVVVFRKRRSSLRHALLLLALAKFVIPPLWASPLGIFSWLLVRPQAAPLPDVPPAEMTMYAWLVLYLSLGAVAVLAYVGVEYIQVRRCVARARHITDAHLREAAEGIAAKLAMRRAPRLLTSAHYPWPRAGGRVRPYILLPPWCLAMQPRDLHALLAHLAAHIKRRDPWLKPLLALIQALHWWNPAVWWLSARLRAEQELASDDWVIHAGLAEPAWYTSMLVDVADGAGERNVTSQMLGVHEPVRPLKRRILRALDEKATRRPSLRARHWLALLILAAILLPGAPRRQSPEQPPTQRYRYPPVAQMNSGTGLPVRARVVGIAPSGRAG